MQKKRPLINRLGIPSYSGALNDRFLFQKEHEGEETKQNSEAPVLMNKELSGEQFYFAFQRFRHLSSLLLQLSCDE